MGWQDYKVSDVPEGESGDWRVSRITVTQQEEDFMRLRAVINHQREDRTVKAGEYTQLTRNGAIIMSDTPAEIRDHMMPIRMASGHCLVNGLGLGVVANGMLMRDNVTLVTVIEQSEDVAKLVGPHYQAKWGDRFELIVADAFEWKAPRGSRYDCAWHDIWDTISEDNLETMTKLKRRYGRRAGWQGCWQEKGCRAQKRRVATGQGWY